MKIFLIALFISLISSAGLVAWALNTQNTNADYQTAYISALPSSTSAQVTATPTVTYLPTPPPSQAQLTLPFTVQAPFGVWDDVHENTCEEASLIMLKHYEDHTPISSPAQADQELTALVTWEGLHNYGPSISLTQLNQIANDYFGMHNGTVVQINSIDQVKAAIASGHPVILGMAGKLLGNPYFSDGGPNYHMLVVTGYDSSNIITNDPGTKHGEGYAYPSETFYQAIHDWDSSNILNGQKAYLVFK